MTPEQEKCWEELAHRLRILEARVTLTMTLLDTAQLCLRTLTERLDKLLQTGAGGPKTPTGTGSTCGPTCDDIGRRNDE